MTETEIAIQLAWLLPEDLEQWRKDQATKAAKPRKCHDKPSDDNKAPWDHQTGSDAVHVMPKPRKDHAKRIRTQSGKIFKETSFFGVN